MIKGYHKTVSFKFTGAEQDICLTKKKKKKTVLLYACCTRL